MAAQTTITYKRQCKKRWRLCLSHNVGGGNIVGGSVRGIDGSNGLVVARAVMAMTAVMMMVTANGNHQR